jgi:hypothetical protein
VEGTAGLKGVTRDSWGDSTGGTPYSLEVTILFNRAGVDVMSTTLDTTKVWNIAIDPDIRILRGHKTIEDNIAIQAIESRGGVKAISVWRIPQRRRLMTSRG